MDALEFLKERRRMCKSSTSCNECPLKGIRCLPDSSMSDEDYERAITTVEKWSVKCPRKTRQDLVLEQWPNAEFDSQGVIAIDPCVVDKSIYSTENCSYDIAITCDDCRREFWMQEVE